MPDIPINVSTSFCLARSRSNASCVVRILGFPHDLEKHLVRDVHFPAREHFLLATFLFFEELHFPSHVAAVQVARHVFAQSGFAAAGDDTTLRSCLDFELEKLFWPEFLPFVPPG